MTSPLRGGRHVGEEREGEEHEKGEVKSAKLEDRKNAASLVWVWAKKRGRESGDRKKKLGRRGASNSKKKKQGPNGETEKRTLTWFGTLTRKDLGGTVGQQGG